MADPERVGAQRRQRLSHPLIETLQEKIFSGELGPGDQLPTEQQLVSEFGVSRTVVREAISGLRANGLVDARQGRGVFVTDRKLRFEFSAFGGDLGELGTILELLELRLPVEIEAAGLAAMRRSPAQEARIRLAFNRLAQSIEQGESAVGADFDLHMAIVEATNNHFYVDVLKFLGQKTIPRSQLSSGPASDPQGYLDLIQGEHARIVDAISEQDADRARAEMRTHLLGSLNRYRSLMTKVHKSSPSHL